MNDKLYLTMNEELNKEMIRSYHSRVSIIPFTMSQGASTCYIDQISMGKNPSRMYLLFQTTSRFEGM